MSESPARRQRAPIPLADIVEWVGFLFVLVGLVGLVVASAMVSTALAVGVGSFLSLFGGVTAVGLANRYASAPGGDRS